jgi:para-aminobenzoate synthetase / 4-amino-4-deoxychorismate lyase
MNDPGKPKAYFIGEGWGCSSRTGFSCEADLVIQADSIDQIIPALQELEKQTHNGWTAFGYIAYEAAASFGLPINPNPSGHPPLLWFGLCKANSIQQIKISDLPLYSEDYLPTEFKLNLTEECYTRTIAQIKQHIERGETYQVNYTIRSSCIGAESGLELFSNLYRAQPVPYAAYIQTDDWRIHSLSPELFLNKHGRLITSRPMKGTISRGLTPEQDKQKIEQLKQSAKDQAENIMILDMVRNDLGRICQSGSVHSHNICQVERYRSLFHLTSSVQGELSENVTLTDIFQAAFPAASITGAPKHRTMEIIRNYEDSPRSVYCGAIGLIKPDGDFTFNVAIRTMYGSKGEYTLGVGGGIVWDSDAQMEYEEVKTKMAFARKQPAQFQIIETLRLNQNGYYSF